MTNFARKLWTGGLAMMLALPLAATAQTDPPSDLMIVLDGSGSMWGQIGGRTKIEIARETLSNVLSETQAGQNIGLVVYGHRVRGQCSDIELLVPPAAALQAAPQIIAAAGDLNPVGMTPLSDSVRLAAEHLRFTERAATVVLVTDGIETCAADPCSLGLELAGRGLDFTAHVVGFGMNAEEGAQVACLAEATGGRFFLANDPQALSDALVSTLIPAEDLLPDESDFLPDIADAAPREVRFVLRGVDGGEPLRNGGHLSLVLTADDPEVRFDPPYLPAATTGQPFSASATLPPGSYGAVAGFRIGHNTAAVTESFDFVVDAGEGIQTIEATLAAALRIRPLLSAGEPYDRSIVTASGGELEWEFIPVVDGIPDMARGFILPSNAPFDGLMTSGVWLVRGILARVVAREMLVDLAPGQLTELDFDFGVSRVFFDFQGDGTPIRAGTLYPFGRPAEGHWRETRFLHPQTGQLQPILLPVGVWLLRGGDYHNADNRGEAIVEVPAAGRTITVSPQAGEAYNADAFGIFESQDYVGCLERVRHGACLVQRVEF